MRNTLIKTAAASASLVAVLGMASTAFAAHTPNATPTAPGQNKIQCFDGTTDGGFGGTCTLANKGVSSPATLDNSSSSPTGDYSGVYYSNSSNAGKLLKDVVNLGYTYTGNVSPSPTRLSLNVPIATSTNGLTDHYAFIDAYYCPGVNGVVDVLNDPNCGIYDNGSVFYPNWSAFAAANPTYRVANAPIFIVAERVPSDVSQTWTITNFNNGLPGNSGKNK